MSAHFNIAKFSEILLSTIIIMVYILLTKLNGILARYFQFMFVEIGGIGIIVYIIC
jgi:hypothetical protein